MKQQSGGTSCTAPILDNCIGYLRNVINNLAVARGNFGQELIIGRSCGHSLSARSRVRDSSGVTVRVSDLGRPKHVIRREIERDWNVWNKCNKYYVISKLCSLSIVFIILYLKMFQQKMFKQNFDKCLLNSISLINDN